MRAASLDRRVRKEAVLLVREARTAVAKKPGLKGKAGDLESVTSTVEKALAASDLQTVRHHLPVLDAIVDEVVARPGSELLAGQKKARRAVRQNIVARILAAEAPRRQHGHADDAGKEASEEGGEEFEAGRKDKKRPIPDRCAFGRERARDDARLAPQGGEGQSQFDGVFIGEGQKGRLVGVTRRSVVQHVDHGAPGAAH